MLKTLTTGAAMVLLASSFAWAGQTSTKPAEPTKNTVSTTTPKVNNAPRSQVTEQTAAKRSITQPRRDRRSDR